MKAADLGQLRQATGAITRAAASDNLFYGICHTALHAMGPTLIEYYGSIVLALPHVNTIDCGNGLAHGAFDAWAAQKPVRYEFEIVAEACEQVEKVSPGGCAEGLGHAAFQHIPDGPERITRAFRLCELFKDPANAEHCAYGTIMQPYFKQNDALISEEALPIPDGSDLVALCLSQPVRQDVVHGCMSGAGWLMGVHLVKQLELIPAYTGGRELQVRSQAFLNEVESGIRDCLGASTPEHTRTECSRQMLARLPWEWYQDSGLLIERCGRLGERFGPPTRFDCLAGAYEFVSPDRLEDLVIRFPEVAVIVAGRNMRERGTSLTDSGG